MEQHWIRTLLIVDDEPEAREGYQAYLGAQAGPISPSSPTSSRSSRSAPAAQKQVGAKRETYHLIVAASGEEALEKAKAVQAEGKEIAAGFFDVKLGSKLDGLQVIQEVRKIFPDIHAVVVTAYQDRGVEEIQDLFGLEFNDRWDYLNKPFSEGEIVQKARQMISSFNNKRDLAEIQRHLIDSERLAAIGQVARGVGHEFGNILLRIMGKADLAMMESDPEKQKVHLEVIIKASERAGVIVHNLQSFTKTRPQLVESSVTEPIEDSLSLVGHELKINNVEVIKEFETEGMVKLDKGKIAQVLLNLFINARHAMHEGGRLTIKTVEEPGVDDKDGYAIRVKDTGSGIPAEIVDQIFEYAFTTKGEEGSGLGLSISRQILEEHGGEISVVSSSSSGTEFRVWLPKR